MEVCRMLSAFITFVKEWLKIRDVHLVAAVKEAIVFHNVNALRIVPFPSKDVNVASNAQPPPAPAVKPIEPVSLSSANIASLPLNKISIKFAIIMNLFSESLNYSELANLPFRKPDWASSQAKTSPKIVLSFNI